MLFFFFVAASANYQQLYDWCRNDTACSTAYHIVDFTQDEVDVAGVDVPDAGFKNFEFLAVHWVGVLRPPRRIGNRREMREAVEEHYAFKFPSHMSDRELNASMRAHWVLLLRLSATENRSVNCGTNNRLVISPDGLDSYCQCIDNRNCDDGGNWRSKWNLATASTVSVSVLIVFYLIVSIVHHINKIHFFHEYRLRLHENDAAKEELIKGE